MAAASPRPIRPLGRVPANLGRDAGRRAGPAGPPAHATTAPPFLDMAVASAVHLPRGPAGGVAVPPPASRRCYTTAAGCRTAPVPGGASGIVLADRTGYQDRAPGRLVGGPRLAAVALPAGGALGRRVAP